MNRQSIVKKVSSVTAQLASLVATVCVVIATGAVMASAGGYSVTYLGGNNYSTVYSINNLGQAVGFDYDGVSVSNAVLWSNGTVTDLDALAGRPSRFYSINDTSQMVGYSIWGAATTISAHATLFSNNILTDLGIGLGPQPNSFALNINNTGQVVGYATAADGNYHAALFSNGTVIDLGTLSGGTTSRALCINDSGQAVGYSLTTIEGSSGYQHAVLFSNNTITDLGFLDSRQSYAYSINNVGQAVGWAYTASGASHAALFSDGKVTDLNTLVDPTLSWYFYEATGINDGGQIVVNGSAKNNGYDQPHAFLLTPYGHLSITKTGTGIGSITSSPSGIDCSASCSSQGANFLLGTVVSIAATPFLGGSIFTGWSGDSDCSDGIVTMNTDISCSATFDLCGYPALIGATPYDSIGAAYAYAAASGDTIQVTASNQMEMLNFTLSKNITLNGGYDCAFSNLLSYTTIKGSLTIRNGTVTIAGIAIN